MIYVCAITVGIMSYYMADRKHRKAFLEARQSLEVKLNLEEQSQQQVTPDPSGCYSKLEILSFNSPLVVTLWFLTETSSCREGCEEHPCSYFQVWVFKRSG